jgi:hypothetical protein
MATNEREKESLPNELSGGEQQPVAIISSLVSSQELLTEGSTGVIYWEGAVAGKGTSAGKPITCEGYVELTGYAGSLGGLF